MSIHKDNATGKWRVVYLYATLPQLNLYTYQMSENIKAELQQGIEINGETEEYAF